MNRDRIIETLNEGVSLEMGGIMQYMWHNFTGEGEQRILDQFKQTAVEEMLHLVQLAERVVALGGEPLARLPEFRRGGDLRRMMEDDMHREEDVAKRYQEFINLCNEEGDGETRTILEGILTDEKRHVDLWRKNLGY